LITTSTAATLPQDLPAGSFVRATLAPGLNAVRLDVAGEYTGRLELLVAYQGDDEVMRVWPAASISNLLTPGLSGIDANGAGSWATTIPGPGYVYVVARSLASGSAKAAIGVGPAGTDLYREVGSAAKVQNVRLLGVGADVAVAGHFVDAQGNRVGDSFAGTAPAHDGASKNAPFRFAVALASFPAAAVGARVTLDGDVYWDAVPAGDPDEGDFSANPTRYQTAIADPEFNAFGRVG